MPQSTSGEKKVFLYCAAWATICATPAVFFSCGMDGTYPGDSKTSHNIGMHNAVMVLESRERGSLPHNAVHISGRAPDPRPPQVGRSTDFHETHLTLRWCSSELRRSFRTSRHVFVIRIARSREWEGPHSMRLAARNPNFKKREDILSKFQDPGH